MHAFLRDRARPTTTTRHDDLAGDAHLPAQRPPALGLRLAAASWRARRASARGGAPFVRQLCWRDFHHQVLAADPDPAAPRLPPARRPLVALASGPSRPGARAAPATRWSTPAMRQLAAEGFMHNRARMTVGSFLTKDLYVDWRAGAWHFWDLLSRRRDRQQRRQLAVGRRDRQRHPAQPRAEPGAPGRTLRPRRRSTCAATCRSWSRSRGKAIFRPWLMEGFERLDYPEPIVDHDEAVAAFRPAASLTRRSSPPLPGLLRSHARIAPMGRLAVILGCNALGPGGEEIAAAAAEHGAAIVQRHGSRRRLRPPPPDRPRRQPAAAGRAGLRPRAGDRLGRLAAHRARRSAASSAPTTSSPSRPRRLDLRRRPRPHRPRLRRPLARRSARGLGRRRRGAGRRRRLLADDRAALRDPGRDPPDRRARRRGRDDDRLRVRRSPASSGSSTRRSASSTTSPTGSAEGELERRRDGSRPADQRDPAARRPRRGPAAARRGRPVSARSGRHADARASTASASALRCARRRDDRRARARGRRRARRRDDRRRRRADPRAAAGQRPHPRGDDALPRLRRRPAADALAGGTDLAGRGEARGRGRLLGRAARLRWR